jgi:hypothetical protein
MYTAGRRMFSTALPKLRAPKITDIITPVRVAFGAGIIVGMPVMTGEEFFEHKFMTTKSPDDVADFYSTEDFLQILGVFPMAIHFVLAGVEWDTEKENTMSVHNAMEISFTIEEREEETASGDKVVAFFQKRERFKNYIPFTRFLMWDQTQCYGYNRMENGNLEIFHRGEVFYGPLPVRMLVQAHAYYVIWATEKHINSLAFGSGDLELQEHQRSNVPLHVFNDFLTRLQLAQQVAIESGKLVAGTSKEEAEQALTKIRRLRQSPTQAYVTALRKTNLKRTVSHLQVSDPDVQNAVDSALLSLSATKEGQTAAANALDGLLKHPEVVEQKPIYGGAFNARRLDGFQNGKGDNPMLVK